MMMKILIATEDLTDRLLLQLMTRRLGYEPTPSSDGSHLLALMARGGFDAVLFDVQHPLLDGGKAVRTIVERGADGWRPLIIGLTTAVRAPERRTPLERLMDVFLLKPVDEASLRNMLERIADLPVRPSLSETLEADPTPLWVSAMVRRLESLHLLDDPRGAAKLIADYLLAADHHVVAVSEPMTAYDQPALAANAQGLAALSDEMGLNDLAAQCRELEATATAGEGPLSSDLRDAIEASYRRLRPRLLRYRTSLLSAAAEVSRVQPQSQTRHDLR